MEFHLPFGKKQNDVGGGTDPLKSSALDLGYGGLAAAGVALLAFKQNDLLQDNLDLATNYYNKNLTDFIFWSQQYGDGAIPSNSFTPTQTGPMLDSLAESMNRPLYENTTNPTDVVKYGKLDYLASIGRGRSVSPRKLDKQWLATRKRINNYGVGMGRWVDYQFGINRLNEDMNGWNIGFRFEDTRKYKYDEQRHSHRTQILNLGIGFGNTAREGLASSVAALSESRAQLASQFGSLSNDIQQKSSYDKVTKRLQTMSKNAPRQNMVVQ